MNICKLPQSLGTLLVMYRVINVLPVRRLLMILKYFLAVAVRNSTMLSIATNYQTRNLFLRLLVLSFMSSLLVRSFHPAHFHGNAFAALVLKGYSANFILHCIEQFDSRLKIWKKLFLKIFHISFMFYLCSFYVLPMFFS